MYAAIAKNGEPINGIKAGILWDIVVSVSISRRDDDEGDDDDDNRVATQITDFTTTLKAFAISGAREHVSSPNRARANERVTNESQVKRKERRIHLRIGRLDSAIQNNSAS